MVQLEHDAHRILAAQSAYALQAEALGGEWQAAPAEAAAGKLLTLVAYHQERAKAYASEYQRFDAVYMTIYDALQQAIADAAREIERKAKTERKAKSQPIEALKANLRAAPGLHRLIRWLRGVDSAM